MVVVMQAVSAFATAAAGGASAMGREYRLNQVLEISDLCFEELF